MRLRYTMVQTTFGRARELSGTQGIAHFKCISNVFDRLREYKLAQACDIQTLASQPQR
jgi:hypothetical protein